MNPNNMNSLEQLIKSDVLVGLKIETEAEGSSWLGINRLAVIAGRLGLPMYVKIGGCEAKTDIIQLRWLDVDGVIGPMIESAFSTEKFGDALATGWPGLPSERMVLIETITALENLDSILDSCQSFATGINFGRSDFAASLLAEKRVEQSVSQDSDEVLNLMGAGVVRAKAAGFRTCMGGRMTAASVAKLQSMDWTSSLDRIETRRLVLSWPKVANKPEVLNDVLKAEYDLAHGALTVLSDETAMLSRYVGEVKSRIVD
jgi:hypothetical protein